VAQSVSRRTFPFGGGEYRAIFAYSDGYLPAALAAFRVHIGAVVIVLALMIAVRYPLPWAVLALAASAVGCRYWWSVVAFPYQRSGFRTTLAALLVAIPPICFAVGAGVHRLRVGLAERRAVIGVEDDGEKATT
jgi:hypothetical protein